MLTWVPTLLERMLLCRVLDYIRVWDPRSRHREMSQDTSSIPTMVCSSMLDLSPEGARVGYAFSGFCRQDRWSRGCAGEPPERLGNDRSRAISRTIMLERADSALRSAPGSFMHGSHDRVGSPKETTQLRHSRGHGLSSLSVPRFCAYLRGASDFNLRPRVPLLLLVLVLLFSPLVVWTATDQDRGVHRGARGCVHEYRIHDRGHYRSTEGTVLETNKQIDERTKKTTTK